MSDIKDRLDKIIKSIDVEKVLLVAVTKTRSPEEINEAIEMGVTDIGENKVQEIIDKYDRIRPVRWHMIGHLQTNKVKYIIDKVKLIHSVDSLKLATEIDKRAGQKGLIMDILLQVNIADEDSKHGVGENEVEQLMSRILSECKNIRIRGLMAMMPFVEDPETVRPYFAKMKVLYDRLAAIKHERADFRYLSMGMSGDYQVAMEEGANLVRIGSSIFGPRVYQ